MLSAARCDSDLSLHNYIQKKRGLTGIIWREINVRNVDKVCIRACEREEEEYSCSTQVVQICDVERCSGGNCMNQKKKQHLNGWKKMWWKKCAGRERGLVGVSASELEPMKSEMGQARGGDAVTATHSTRLGLMSSTSQSWHKLCLPECFSLSFSPSLSLPLCHTHIRTSVCTHTRKVRCNLRELHTYAVPLNYI